MSSGFKLSEIQPKVPAEWETWLEINHATSEGIWVVFEKKSKIFDHGHALDAALCYGWIDAQTRRISDLLWTQKFMPRRPKSIWSKINCGKALAFIESGQMKPAGLREVERAQADGRWDRAYNGPATSDVPEDLSAELAKRPKAKAFFAALSSQNRYAILFRLQTAKKVETRAKRLAQFVEMLEKGQTLH